MGRSVGEHRVTRFERVATLRAQVIAIGMYEAIQNLPKEHRASMKQALDGVVCYAISAIQPFNIECEEKIFKERMTAKSAD